MKIQCQDTTLDLSLKTHIMGILNVTPDSFSDGGLYYDKDVAVSHAMRLIEEGADIIDIGGESTRPGSEPLSIQEELDRVIPVIKGLSKQTNTPISIDTYKAEVAKGAVEAGASIINDISGLGFSPQMAETAAKLGVPLIIMHIKGVPKDMQKNPVYEALIPEMLDYFRERMSLALKSGIREDKLIIDPGIGFGKTFDHNLQIIRDLRQFTVFHKPLVVGVSRKAFLGAVTGNLPPDERIEATIAASVIAIVKGANILRVHDVKAMVRAAKTADAVLKASAV